MATRNGVAEALTCVHGENWPWSNGFRRSLPRPKRRQDYDPQSDLETVAARQPTTGKVVADLKFAFWEKLFTVGQDARLWEPHFRRCFPSAPAEMPIAAARALAFSDIQSIRKLRNRIAHHEPIFSRAVLEDYRRILSLISWRSRTAATWVERIQTVTAIIPDIPLVG